MSKNRAFQKSLLSGYVPRPVSYRVDYQAVETNKCPAKNKRLNNFIGNRIFDQFHIRMKSHLFKDSAPKSTDGIVA